MCSLTRVGDLNLDGSALEVLSVKSQSSLQTFDICKFGVSESFRTLFDSILDNTNAGDITILEEVCNGLLSGFVGQIAQMSGVRGLGRELSGA